MIDALIVIGIILGYFGIGTIAMRAMLPAIWRTQLEANREYRSLGKEFARTDVRIWSWMILLGWPLALPVAFGRAVINQAIDRTDPGRIAAELKDRERRIRELELELGIHDPAPRPRFPDPFRRP